jgi:hypothetical protein
MGIEIPDRRWTVLVVVLLALAGYLPMATLRQRTGVMLSLTYSYTYSHMSFYGSNTFSSETFEFNILASMDNVSQVLASSQVRGYPLWLNVSDWDEISNVTIRFTTATIDGKATRSGYPCWRLSLVDGTSLYYHEYVGIFVGSYYSEFSTSVSTSRRVDLTDDNIADLVNPGYIVNADAIFFSIILIELIILIGLARRKK